MALNEKEPTPYPTKRTHYPEIGTPEVRRQIGQELKTAREFQQMTLEQVYVITKINVRFLENLEEGRWNFLPPTYVKAFIKAYATAVGIPLEKISNRLDDLFSSVVMAVAPEKPQFSIEEEITEKSEYTKYKSVPGASWFEKNKALVFYIILGILSALLIFYYLTQEPKIPFIDDVLEDTTLTQNNNGKPIDIKSTVNSTSIDSELNRVSEPPQTMNLLMSATDTCYVKIEFGENILFEKNILPGGSEQLTLPINIRMTLGNAPAMNLTVNQKALPSFPPLPKVRIFKLSSEGITE